MSVGRNDPCPCGSGIKYKYCCEGKTAWHENTVLLGVGVVALLLVGLLVAGMFFAEEQDGPPYERPAGEAPPGKVWSPEHGHWHNAY